ncbi:glutaminyl-peptide cyclotransferase [Euzebya sp.]|uniref:glutaminyl-peptide cyclotransferase n=1 Tax=Euzebya sp. TaxID=1971409 RepID=UPI003513603F
MRAPALLTSLCLLVVACAPAGDQAVEVTADPSTAVAASAAGVPAGDVLQAVEVDRRPHDPEAFTQGLEFHEGRLFESRGLYEQSAMTEIDPATGEVLARTDLDDAFFGEGATVVGDRIIQLTWREGTAFTYDVDTLEPTGELAYEGEGWGICDLPDRLVMSDGTDTLDLRDPDTFEVVDSVVVDLAGQPNDDLNELECVDGLVWANLWNTNTILVIDPDTGDVVSEVDVSALADDAGRFVEEPRQGAVLNGIAHDPETGTWLLTGKEWPVMVEVTFTCVEGCEGPTVTPTHYVRPRGPAVSSRS